MRIGLWRLAPEFDGLLEARARIVEAAGGRSLGPSPRLIALAADKQRMAEHLATAQVPAAFGEVVDAGNLLAAAAAIGYPTVLKPRDGAGSKDVRLIADRTAAEQIHEHHFENGRLERFYPGVATSVAVLCGPNALFSLPACRQHLSDDGQFRYFGGSCPLEPALAQRAGSIAIRAVRSLADPLGYLGVDLVLGADPNGKDDVVIEINPRLTTSYVGLRAIANGNLAAAMMAIAEGGAPQSFVRWQRGGLRRRRNRAPAAIARRYRILSFLIPAAGAEIADSSRSRFRRESCRSPNCDTNDGRRGSHATARRSYCIASTRLHRPVDSRSSISAP